MIRRAESAAVAGAIHHAETTSCCGVGEGLAVAGIAVDCFRVRGYCGRRASVARVVPLFLWMVRNNTAAIIVSLVLGRCERQLTVPAAAR